MPQAQRRPLGRPARLRGLAHSPTRSRLAHHKAWGLPLQRGCWLVNLAGCPPGTQTAEGEPERSRSGLQALPPAASLRRAWCRLTCKCSLARQAAARRCCVHRQARCGVLQHASSAQGARQRAGGCHRRRRRRAATVGAAPVQGTGAVNGARLMAAAPPLPPALIVPLSQPAHSCVQAAHTGTATPPPPLQRWGSPLAPAAAARSSALPTGCKSSSWQASAACSSGWVRWSVPLGMPALAAGRTPFHLAALVCHSLPRRRSAAPADFFNYSLLDATLKAVFFNTETGYWCVVTCGPRCLRQSMGAA